MANEYRLPVVPRGGGASYTDGYAPAAADAKAATDKAAAEKLDTSRPAKGATATAGALHFVCEDMAAIEWWKDADVVYTSSICFGIL